MMTLVAIPLLAGLAIYAFLRPDRARHLATSTMLVVAGGMGILGLALIAWQGLDQGPTLGAVLLLGLAAALWIAAMIALGLGLAAAMLWARLRSG